MAWFSSVTNFTGRFVTIGICTAAMLWPGLSVAQEPRGPVGPPLVTSARPAYWVRQAQSSDPDCYCWAHGRKYGAGERTCIRTTTGPRMALCDRVTNLMSWTPSEESCGES